jgi:hypothetical protein
MKQLAFALALPLLAAAPTCGGVDPAITNVSVHQGGSNGDLNRYVADITVKNLGSAPEKSSVLQSVEIYQDGSKVGQVGTPPLPPGGTATVHYTLTRSSDARPGTTNLRFHVIIRDPHNPATHDCDTANDTFRTRV